MEVITIATHKGGVAKTATAQALAAGLTAQGYKVLAIDLDAQTDLTKSMGADRSKPGAAALLTGTPAAQVIQHTKHGDVIAASIDLADADELNGEDYLYLLKDALKPVAAAYDVAIIDTPASFGKLTVIALTASNYWIIPANPDFYNLDNVAIFAQMQLKKIRQITNPQLQVAGIVFTNVNSRTNLTRDMQENFKQLAKMIGARIFNTYIPRCQAVPDAQAKQQAIYEYNKRSTAAIAYKQLTDEVIKICKLKKHNRK